MMNMMPMGVTPNYNDDPNQVPLMRMSPYGGYQTPVKRYSPIAKLTPKQKTLPENLQRAILKKQKKQGEDPNTALPRKNKFCGGTSKPYGRKK